VTQQRPSEFGRDLVLGSLIRAHLDPGGHEAFAARVLAAIRTEAVARRAALRESGIGQWDLLARWSRIGIAAALLLTAGLAFEFGLQEIRAGEPLTVTDALAPAGAGGGVLSSQAPPEPEVVLTSMLEPR
jgi:hypothetical protein